MKHITIIIICSICWLQGTSQSGYLKAIDPGTDQIFGKCILEYNQDTIVGLSKCYNNDVGWTFYKISFTLFSANGEVLRNDICSDSINMHNDFHNDLFVSGDKIVAYCKGTDLKEYWLIYNPKNGDIEHIYDNMNPDDLRINCSGFAQTSDTTFAAFYNDFDSPYTGGIGLFTNQMLNDYITIIPPVDSRYLIYGDIQMTMDSTLLISGIHNYDEPGGIYIRKPFFEEYTMSGELIWQYILPDEYMNYHVRAILPSVENPKEFVVTASFVKFDQPDGYESHVMKISKATGVVWDIPFGYRVESGSNNHILANIHRSYDDDGYIVSGSIHNHDSLRYEVAVIGKVSDAGDSLWMKSYTIVDSYNAKNTISDFEPTQDGGFIGIGEVSFGGSHDWPTDVDFRRMLLIRTDKDGNISTSSSTEDMIDGAFSVSCFPNPVSDFLSIYQQESISLHYTIVDSSGRELYAFSNTYGDHYTFVDTSRYPDGHYYVVIQDDTGNVESLPFVVKP